MKGVNDENLRIGSIKPKAAACAAGRHRGAGDAVPRGFAVGIARPDPGILYVDGTTGSDTTGCTNPAAPCETIGYALTQAGNGDEIRVAEGTYTETLDIHITVTLKGGCAISGTAWLPRTGDTVIDANGVDDAAIWIYPGANVTVEGFIVQGANHTSDGGGGFLIDRATVTISDTVIQDNTAVGQTGGGIDVQGGTLSLVNSSLLNNTAGGEGGGLMVHNWDIITLDNVDVRGNTAQHEGGGLSVYNVTITNSRIVSNTSGWSGGGISANTAYIYNSEISGNEINGIGETWGGGITSRGHLVIRDSTVSNNRAAGICQGGGISAEGEATIVNTVISGNSVPTGPAGVTVNAVLTMTNCLVISNTSDGQNFQGHITGTIANVTVADNPGGGMHVGGAVVISNSIIWGNEGGDYWCVPGGCTLAYSDVGSGDSTGTGNISADPRFVDAANGDYHLGVGSPCVDKGTLVGAPTHDIEGTPRDAAPDMGAYEWTGFRIFLPLALRNS
jgi:predicted outer membrane repeat protein